MKSTFRSFGLLLAVALSTSSLVGCVAEEGTTDDNYVTDSNRQDAPAYFEVWKGDSGEYWFHLKAANHEIVLQSEGYESKAGAENGVESVKVNAVELANFELRESADGAWYFVLKAQNHEIIGVSETYVSKSNAERGYETVNELVAKLLRWEAAETGGAHFTVFVGEDELIYFNLKGANGEIVLQSEGYESRGGADNGIESVRENGRDLANYEIDEAVGGAWYFVLKAQNGEIIGVSEMYVSKSNAERGAETVAELIRSERVAEAQ